MTWTALFQTLVPYILYDTLEKAAYLEYFGIEKPDSEISTRDHYTIQVMAWEEIFLVNGVVWGPLFVLGLIALSDIL